MRPYVAMHQGDPDTNTWAAVAFWRWRWCPHIARPKKTRPRACWWVVEDKSNRPLGLPKKSAHGLAGGLLVV